jgi:DNA-binding NarL/FixJ family response regulator
MDNVNVLIADNQSFTRIGITAILQSYLNSHLVIVHIKTKEELNEKIILNQPHLLIIDFDFFDFSSLTELSVIRKNYPSIGILVITDNNSPENILKVLDCGITNYILKTCDEQELIEAFNATVNNRKYFSGQVLNVLLDNKSTLRNHHTISGKITPAELEIIKLITQGLTTKEIASQKKLSYHTIITHRKNIFRKLSINSISELIMYAMRIGLIDTTEYYI